LLQAQGKYTEVEPLYRRALETREKRLGPSNPNTTKSLNNLALLLRAQGQYPAAELLLRRAPRF
ncbi:MAG: tetratricopeptide repeat protein, partial [bacterium]